MKRAERVVVVKESMKALFYSFIVDSMHPILHGMAFKKCTIKESQNIFYKVTLVLATIAR